MTSKINKVFYLLTMLLLVSCSGMRPTVFVNKQYNFNFLEKVAVVPFENLSNDQGAGSRITHIFVTELLAAESFDLAEPGEVSKVTQKYIGSSGSSLTKDQIAEVGKALGVQGIILGSVNETSTVYGGGTATIEVTVDARLVETETGQTVWSATHTDGGRGFWASLFGTGSKSEAEAARKCVKRVVRTLVK
jgi:polysaccharide biosynthesis protein PelC